MTRFTETASRLAGIAGLLLGWRPDEFWRATPVELKAIFDAAAGDAAQVSAPDGAVLAKLREMYPDG
jgi:hypothetical protein